MTLWQRRPRRSAGPAAASVDESGRLLSIVGESGDCDRFTSAEVDESAAGVTVTVRMRHVSGTCTVRLDVGAVTVRLGGT